jgi:hypothetical protein
MLREQHQYNPAAPATVPNGKKSRLKTLLAATISLAKRF